MLALSDDVKAALNNRTPPQEPAPPDITETPVGPQVNLLDGIDNPTPEQMFEAMLGAIKGWMIGASETVPDFVGFTLDALQDADATPAAFRIVVVQNIGGVAARRLSA